ncbi:hypothetical protein M2333_000622 [Sphingobium sp. B11D3B]|uniref:CmcJ/NvfI family oxidoreductase n=1 Tax=Sphingobium sp. B11D3B TaxID=2940575 RepID=UPI002227C346|nr:CmcJ/NvfI family oxidoreductase [Sphingobium sp. B11D3B]MCW2387576.1 hypothetical protein [Sphingobium sp. B11D3B]
MTRIRADRPSVTINYVARTSERPRYYANDHSRDTVVIEEHGMAASDGRHEVLGLDTAGVALVEAPTAVTDFADKANFPAYAKEIEALLLRETGADVVIVTGPPILRFSERSGKAGSSDNSHPARFAHVDVSDATARGFSAQRQPAGEGIARAAHYNVWRVLSPAPQDVPLAICDARSVTGEELLLADAIFDSPSGDWSFEGYVVAHDPAHRWLWFPDMTTDEAIIFKTHDSRAGVARCVPHVAFDDPLCDDEAPPRISVEARAIAYWREGGDRGKGKLP